MPTILQIGKYRFHFYSNEGEEPAHIHVRCAECKFWPNPVVIARNRSIAPHDLREIERLVFQYERAFIEKHHEFHGH